MQLTRAEVNFKKLAAAEGFGAANEDFESLCKEEKGQEAMLKALNDAGKKAGFKSLEVRYDLSLN